MPANVVQCRLRCALWVVPSPSSTLSPLSKAPSFNTWDATIMSSWKPMGWWFVDLLVGGPNFEPIARHFLLSACYLCLWYSSSFSAMCDGTYYSPRIIFVNLLFHHASSPPGICRRYQQVDSFKFAPNTHSEVLAFLEAAAMNSWHILWIFYAMISRHHTTCISISDSVICEIAVSARSRPDVAQKNWIGATCISFCLSEYIY